MSDRFLPSIIQFIQGTLAKSAEVNTGFSQVQAGFDAATLEHNTALRIPATESANDLARLPAAAARASKWIAFDAAGNPIATMTLPADMDATGHRIRNVTAPVGERRAGDAWLSHRRTAARSPASRRSPATTASSSRPTAWGSTGPSAVRPPP
jgi:hypothetical protein